MKPNAPAIEGEAMQHLEDLERLAKLRESGVLTEEEFNTQKRNLLAGRTSTRPPTRSAPSPAEEQDVDDFRGSTFGWLLGSFAGWMTLLLCVSPVFGLMFGANIAEASITFAAAGLGLLIVGVKWIGNISARYELTTQRLILRTGIIFKRIDEIELFRVKDVRVDFSLVNQLTGIGTICLRSSDATSGHSNFIMRDIPSACEVRETMRTLVDQARQRRRVRELDVDYEGYA